MAHFKERNSGTLWLPALRHSRSTNFRSIHCVCLPSTQWKRPTAAIRGRRWVARPIAYLLFHKLMKHNPAHSKWADRDRFVLSNGHASALLYGTLFLCGYKVTLDDLKTFRRWGSITPGHPEYGLDRRRGGDDWAAGAGIGMAVGMAIAEKHLAATYNKPGFNVVDHHTFVLCGDGDLMEGLSHEAASLAGTLGLGKLIVLYDDNLISLDGPTKWSFTENVLQALRGLQLACAARDGRQRPGWD